MRLNRARLHRSAVVGLGSLVVGSLVIGLSERLTVRAQQAPEQVFRAGTTLVNVDVYPRRDGKVVEDLKAEDFQIFEDGKPQRVASFELVRSAINPIDSERRDPSTAADSLRQAADPHNRLFVVYLDIAHVTVSGSHEAHTPIVTFLNRSIGANDLFAVMTPDMPVTQLTFGRRTETLDGEMRKFWTWGQSGRDARNDMEHRLAFCLEPDVEPAVLQQVWQLHRDDMTSLHLESLVRRLGDLRDQRKNVLLLTEGWDPHPPVSSAPSRGGSIPDVGIGPGGRVGMPSSMPGGIDQAWCNAQLNHLYGIDFERRFRDLLALARRANVSFYPIDVGGLKTDVTPASSPSRALTNPQVGIGINTLRTLAENTDGAAIVNTNDVTGAMRRVAEATAAYYLLTYYSTNPANDGRYRQIEVKVNVPGVQVTARRGYVATTEADRRAEAAALARVAAGPSPVDVALTSLGRIRGDGAFYTQATATTTEISVVAEIASRETDAGRWKNGGLVTVSATPTSGGAAVTAEQRIEPGTRSTVVRLPIVPAVTTAETWRVTTRIRGDEGVLDDGISVTTEIGAAIGAPTLFRAAGSPRAPLRPTADLQFSRTERIHVEWLVTAGAGTTTSARLLGRRGDALPIPVAVSQRETPGGSLVSADLTLAPLAQGDYVIELAVQADRRLIAFRVTR